MTTSREPKVTGLVSVIIPAYNAAAYVAEAVDSVLAQDYPHVEVIVVNDGSKDNTLEVLRGYGDRIRVIDQANAGPPKARNAGLAAVRGEYVAFLDADDIWLPTKLSAQVAHLVAHADVGTVFTRWFVWPADADGVFRIPAVSPVPVVSGPVVASRSGWMYTQLLLESHLLTTTVMMRRSLIEAIGGFDVNLFNGDDYDFWLRASREAKVDQLDAVGAYYRVVPGSVSRKARPVNYERVVIEQALKRWGLEDPKAGTTMDAGLMRDHLDRLAIQFGYDHLLVGDPAVAWASYAEVLRRRPWRVTLWPAAAKALAKRLLS
ncbi:glycosyltransferase family A protein [Roseateles sp.]|uniref:glycosyltransferase family 2 protein n=1 Tax=Roseateles sp. TaxID=1971397 RepID=UPI003263744E